MMVSMSSTRPDDDENMGDIEIRDHHKAGLVGHTETTVMLKWCMTVAIVKAGRYMTQRPP